MKKKLLGTFCVAATLAVGVAGAENRYAPLTYEPQCNLGQALVDVETAKHPELKILTVHVTPKGMSPDTDAERRLFFSNIGRVSKVDNATDGDVYRGGKEVVEVEKEPAPASTNFKITATPKYEVLEILRNKAGQKIGLIVMVFPYHENFDLEQYHRVAQQVAEELKVRIDHKDDLFGPA